MALCNVIIRGLKILQGERGEGQPGPRGPPGPPGPPGPGTGDRPVSPGSTHSFHSFHNFQNFSLNLCFLQTFVDMEGSGFPDLDKIRVCFVLGFLCCCFLT